MNCVKAKHVTWLVFVILFLSRSYASPSTEANLKTQFDRLKGERNHILRSLITHVEYCVRRRDSNHTAFHGCVDWHSAVHGTWALVKFTRFSGDKRFLPLIAEILLKEKLDAELQVLQQDRNFEMPYGRAWFLRLVQEHKETFDSELLIPMGDYVSHSLMQYYGRSPPDPWRREYDNASWALINLYDYGISRNDQAIVTFVTNLVRKYFVPVGRPCPIHNEEGLWPDFMPVCTTWAYLVARAASPIDLKAWVNKFLPRNVVITPIRKPHGDHHMGMNFSRSWGFWYLYSVTKDQRFLRLYLDHFALQFNNATWWSGDYRTVGHWVPQFGVYAVAGLYS